MTYTSGQLIQAADFNNFVGNGVSGPNLNATWSTAYGQSAVGTVSQGAVVTATLWATLNNDLTAVGQHQGTSLTSRTSPVAGNTITILNNLGTDISTCYTNRFNAASSGSQVINWTGTASQTSATGAGQSAWNIVFTDTVTFANATAASNFFNAGGLMKIQFHKSSTGQQADTDWNNFVNNICGTVYLTADLSAKTINGQSYPYGTYTIGGSGSPTYPVNAGFAQLSSSPTTIWKQNDSTYNYTGDYVQIQATSASGVLTLTTTWYSAARSTSDPSRSIAGGTATAAGTVTFGSAPTTVVTYIPPETTYIANTWGAITIASSVSSTPYS
jgi:hypothetical protein